MNAAEQIRMQIEQIPLGEPFTTASLLGLGMRATVDQTLRRLAQSGRIMPVSRGVFVRPKVNRFVGPVKPAPFKIAEAIARSTGAVIQPHGAEAARVFGLTTQMQTQPVYLTTGPTRRVKVGQLVVTLKHAAPRKFGLAGRPGLALSALRYLGKEGVTLETIETVRRQLEPEEFEALRSATGLMPAWLSDRLHRHERAFGRV